MKILRLAVAAFLIAVVVGAAAGPVAAASSGVVPLQTAAPFDADGDGYTDAVDVDGDGYAESVDTDADGVFDVVDTDGDGYFEAVDFDGDGYAESIDSNGDGYAESVDTNLDGYAESVDTDLDGYTDTVVAPPLDLPPASPTDATVGPINIQIIKAPSGYNSAGQPITSMVQLDSPGTVTNPGPPPSSAPLV